MGRSNSVEPHYHIEGLSDPHQWWANATILCTRPSPDYWGSSFVAAYRHMLQEAVSEHDTLEFMLNKRDHPAVRLDGSHPWHHVWSDTPPTVVKGPLLPFLSSYGPGVCRHSDTANVSRLGASDSTRVSETTIDIHHPLIRVQWQDKLDGFFRGSNTGNGTRTALCKYNGSRIHGSTSIWASPGILVDSKFKTGQSKCLNFRWRRSSDSCPCQNREYKYLVCVDGHSAPNCVATLYLTGSLVVRVASDGAAARSATLGRRSLYVREHFIPVAADLSDFGSKLQWMATHPSECEAIANVGWHWPRRYSRRKEWWQG